MPTFRTCRVRQLAAGVGIACAATMIGLTTAASAIADDLDPVPASDGPIYAAYLAGVQLEADEALVPHDLPVAYDSLYNAQLPIEQNAIAALSSTEALQLPNAANITGLDNLIISDIDQYFTNSASDFSSAVTSFESGDVTTTTALNLLGDDLQLENATNYVNFLDAVFPYLGIESSSAADAVAAADPSGPTVADLDVLLQEIGLGSLVTNNDFFLETDSTQSVGSWLLATSSVALFNAFDGVDGSTLTTALIVGFSPAAQDLGDIVNGTGDLATNLSQLGPDLTQGFDLYLQAATELFLSA